VSDAREPRPWVDDAVRAIEVVGGLVAVGVSITVLANPLVSVSTLIILLAVALASDGLRLLLTGGTVSAWWHRLRHELHSRSGLVYRLGRIGTGLVAIALVVAVLLNPSVAPLTLLYLLAAGVVLTSAERILHVAGRGTPRWIRGFSLGTVAVVVVLVTLALTVPSVGLATFAVLIAVSMLLGGVQSVVSGLRPTDPRQIVLLELVLFSLLYGLVLINWIDLFGKSVPGYGIWLILTYFAPFWMMLIYEGFSEWPLALSLGLLVSLANDLGYFFVGNLLFGFHQNLAPWIEGQLGLLGTQLVTIFDAGFATIPVDSWLMGLTIYARAALVVAGLYYWWRHPGRIVARLPSDRSDPS
jgi:uncharacterized membrane protein HdeD (DUF308 family)